MLGLYVYKNLNIVRERIMWIFAERVILTVGTVEEDLRRRCI